MLGLTLRKEFQGKRLEGTAIELTKNNNTGATQISAEEFLEITYPSGDLLKALEAIGPDQGRPIVLMGDRGQGKSHLMAALYHAVTNPTATKAWLQHWSDRFNNPQISNIELRTGMTVISESLHRQQCKFLWDLLFDRHPHGQYIKGKWENLGEKKTDVPPHNLLLELLEKEPIVLLLDEFQTWFDGLKNTKQSPEKSWAFNFIQLLSEIAKEHPELLVLVVSVRNGSTDAYQQIHRVNPVDIDFKGPNASLDRRRLLLHRLFENRLQVAEEEIENLISTHIKESFRLTSVPPADCDRKRKDFIEYWPFAPHLMQLLEDRVLVATDAQETRDLLKILADLFKSKGNKTPIITAADFNLEDESSGIASLLDSVANQHHRSLREKAQRNLSAVQDAIASPSTTVPHLAEIVGALWLRSLSVENQAGAEPATLHLDITRSEVVDDNAFQVELNTIVDHSFNIHQIGDRLLFREEENPQAKLMASARNNKLFIQKEDHRRLAKEIRYVLGGSDDTAKVFRVIVLPQHWMNDPWTHLDPLDHPDNWDDRLPIVVLPQEPEPLHRNLGKWLKEQVQQRRNTIRFLLPKSGSPNLYQDRELLILARAVLKADEWKSQSPEYKKLFRTYQSELYQLIKKRFDRFAILQVWNYADPKQCQFAVESLKAEGGKIPEAIEQRISTDLFIPEDFEEFVLTCAENNDNLGKLLKELQEPRPGGKDCIPWLGETHAKEKVTRLCARGKIALNLRGMEYLQAKPGEDEETAWNRMKSRVGVGKHLAETSLLLPQALPHSERVSNQPDSAVPSELLPIAASVTITDPANQTFSAPLTYSTNGLSSPKLSESVFGREAASKVTPLSAPATSALNLIGKVEAWGINPGTPVRRLTLRVDALNGAQLQQLLRNLPDGLTYELELEKEEF